MPGVFEGFKTVKDLEVGDKRFIEVPLPEAACNMVFAHVCQHLEVTDPPLEKFTPASVYVVWFCKTLQNWKALVSTTLPDGKYYEVTFDGDKKQVYIDTYVKVRNQAYNFVES